MILGLDVGSINCKAVLLDESFRLIGTGILQSKGDPSGVVRTLVKRLFGDRGACSLKIGVTGCGRDIFDFPKEISSFNEIVCLAVGSSLEHPETKSVVEIGGQSSKWLHLDNRSLSETDPEIIDFSLNERCAAGSGAFLEQQATRLKIGIEEFSDLAARAGQGATVAGRCSVFAKTDMIHLQQKGTPIEEIAYGVCLALARNFVATILRGRGCVSPVLFTGGSAQNKGLIRAFREVLKITHNDFIVSKNPFFTCTLGAAGCALKYGVEHSFSDIQSLLKILRLKRSQEKSLLLPLGSLEEAGRGEPSPSGGEVLSGYLGMDVGSVSTNLAFVSPEGEAVAGIYLPTRGRPLEVLKEAYGLLLKKCKGGLKIFGVGATGSARYLAGKFLEADVIHNEITCQLVGTKHYFPDVDTIFEIGGQDSKYVRVKEGRIHDFTMNKICAAGTGSFLEEQAAHLGIDIENEFSSLAECSKNPCDLGSQCTVFMDSELVNALSQGVSVPDISSGLAYSIARNYLEKVVANRSIGKNIVFQGGVASNPSVVKAFSLLLNLPVHVHPYNRISGAIGAALITKGVVEKRERIISRTNQIEKRIRQPYSVKSFQCNHCTNRCQVNRVNFDGKNIYFGDTCERYTSQQEASHCRESADKSGVKNPPVLNMFKEREDLLATYIQNPSSPTLRIALPKTSFLYEYLPFWTTFFNHLGCEVCFSPHTNMEILEMGLKKLPAETCLPIKAAFGHVQWFDKKDVNYIFFPSVIDLHQNPERCHYLCPYCEHAPYMLKSAFDTKLLLSCVNLNSGAEDFNKSMSLVMKTLGKKKDEFSEAFYQALSAQEEFSTKLKIRGREVLEEYEKDRRNLWVILGKPYNIHDAFLNLNLGRHLQKLNVVSLPMDFIDLEEKDCSHWPSLPPWRYNQQIIKTSTWCMKKKNIFPIIVSNFGCGPDAFTIKHLSKILKNKPHLYLEFDEHRGEAGLVTRLEAFWDEIGETQTSAKESQISVVSRRSQKPKEIEEYRKRKFVLPYFADQVMAFSGAMKGVGIEAEVLPLPDAQSLALGEHYSSGKECHAYSILAGDLVKFARTERKGDEVFYFPGTKNICLLAQYGEGMNYLLDDMGIDSLEVLAPSTDFLFKILGIPGLKLLWRGLVAVDLLVKAACERRPYEICEGQTDRIHEMNLEDIEKSIANGSFDAAWKRCVVRLNTIEVERDLRPRVGIAGDVYTRQHPVANRELLRRLEKLGCEVWPAPFLVDDVDFGMRRSISRKLRQKKYHECAAMEILNIRKDIETWKIKKGFKRALSRLSEPSYKSILEFSRPYINPENNRILLLNIAKMVDYAKRGADGIVNVICMNCMLGTVSEAISAQIKKDFDNIPIPTLVFSGSDISSENTRLEAFVHQVKRFAEKTRKEKSIGGFSKRDAL
jgi:predicted CoA-substrate-specific enzyme activase